MPTTLEIYEKEMSLFEFVSLGGYARSINVCAAEEIIKSLKAQKASYLLPIQRGAKACTLCKTSHAGAKNLHL